MRNKLVKNFSLYTLGQLLTQFLSILLLPLYLKKLSVEEYGIVASLMSVATFFNAIMQYGAGPSIMRYYYDYKNNPNAFKGFFTSTLLFNFFANIILVTIIYFSYSTIFAQILPDIKISDYIWYIVFYSVFFAFPVINLSLFRVESKPISFLTFNVTQFILSFAFIFYMVAVLEQGAIGKIKGEFWARVPLFIIGFFLFKKYISFSEIKIKYLKEGLKYSIPLMFQALLWWGLYKVDYFLINRVLGNEGVGIFNVGFQVSYILITIGISFSLAWTPHFYSIAEKHGTKKLYGNIIGNFLMLLSILGLCAILFISDVLLFLEANEYFGILKFLHYLIFGAIFQAGYYMVQQLLFYVKKTALVPIILGVFLVLIFALEYILLPFYGLIGLSIVKAIGFIFIFLTTLLVGMKYYHFKINFRKVNLVLLVLGINTFVLFYLELLNHSFITRFAWVLTNVIGLWFIGFLTKTEKDALIKMIKRE